MKLDVKPNDCKFIVNKEKGKVVCIIPNTDTMFLEYINEEADDCAWYPISAYIMKEKELMALRMPKSFHGVATCASTDTFNEELGKQLAFYRAKTKLVDSFFRRTRAFIDTMDNRLNRLVDELNNYGEKVDKNLNALGVKIEGLMNENSKGTN